MYFNAQRYIAYAHPDVKPPLLRATLSDTSVELYRYTDSDVRPYQTSKRGILKDAELAFVAHASGRAALVLTCYRRAP